jgi:hypothetical protein
MGFPISSKAEKRYMKRLFWTMCVYLLLVLLTTVLVRHGYVSGWAVYAWALLPCIPVLRMIHVLALYIQEETDEFQRLLLVRAVLCGGAAMLAVASCSDFLRSYTPTGNLPPFTMFIVFWVVFGLAQGAQRLMTRADE